MNIASTFVLTLSMRKPQAALYTKFPQSFHYANIGATYSCSPVPLLRNLQLPRRSFSSDSATGVPPKSNTYRDDSHLYLRPRLVHNATQINNYFHQLVRFREKFALALAVVDREMVENGVLPDARIWHIYLRVCEETRQAEKAEAALRLMREQEVIIDALHYSSLLSVMASAGRVSRVNDLLAEMRERNIPLDRNIYTLVISGFAHNKLYEEMFKYYDAMKAAGIRPDFVTFTVLLKVVCRDASASSSSTNSGATSINDASFVRVTSLIKDMFETGHAPGEINRLLLQGFGSNMRADAALDIADRIATTVPELNVDEFLRSVLALWIEKRDAKRAYAVLKKLRSLKTSFSKELQSAYETVFSLFREQNSAQEAQSTINDLLELGGTLSNQMLLGSMELAINYNDIKQATKLAEQIQKNSIVPPVQLANSLLKLFWRFGKEAPAKTAIAYFQTCLPAASWREIEALVATENMGHLLPK